MSFPPSQTNSGCYYSLKELDYGKGQAGRANLLCILKLKLTLSIILQLTKSAKSPQKDNFSLVLLHKYSYKCTIYIHLKFSITPFVKISPSHFVVYHISNNLAISFSNRDNKLAVLNENKEVTPFLQL